MKNINLKTAIILLLTSLVLYLPVFLRPEILLNRNNDLQEFFWPIFHYTKFHILNDQGLPLWLNLIFSGAPLLPDPQSFLFYLPNIIFYILPIPTAFLVSLFLHTFWGSLGVYWVSKHGFKFSIPVSIFTAILFIFTPKLAGYVEAGHFGLAVSFVWIPFVTLSLIKMTKTKSAIWPVIFGASLAQIYFTHTVTFIITAAAASVFFAFTLFLTVARNTWPKSFLRFFAGAMVTFGLSAVTLLPQLEWTPQTTRFLLLENKDIYPKWTSLIEFFQNIFIPWLGGQTDIWSIDSEKWVSLGLILPLLALLGFLSLRKSYKTLILIITPVIVLISLNNASPIHSILESQSFMAMLRVTTRFFFIFTFVALFLAGFGLKYLTDKKINKKIILAVAIIVSLELLSISWARILKPLPSGTKYAPAEVYQFLKSDKEKFRVYCVNRCLSQQKAAEENLELVEGYSTLQQTNYYRHMWQLSGAYWNTYTLSLPPIGTYTFEKPQPDAGSLGLYNTKYVISPYPLTNTNFKLEETIGNLNIYKNNLYKTRAYFRDPVGTPAPLIIYTPNHIQVDTSLKTAEKLILSEVYNKGWNAYLNGVDRVKVQETPDALRQVDLKPNTEYVDFYYEPASFHIGVGITFITLIFSITVAVNHLRSNTAK